MKTMTTQIKQERPILFSPQLAGKVHDGSKTMTRRVVKPQPLSVTDDPTSFEKADLTGDDCALMGYDECPPGFRPTRKFVFDRETMARLQFLRPAVNRKPTKAQVQREMKTYNPRPNDNWWSEREVLGLCPYGVPGDRLFVRESIGYTVDSRGQVVLVYASGDDQAFYVLAEDCGEGDYVALGEQTDRSRCSPVAAWKPSIHMPRWACRTVVELLGVTVERLLSITLADAIAEGFASVADFIEAFYALNPEWRGKDPWVFVLVFHRIIKERPIQ